ncbi:MAG: HAMP domain-containing protein [Anaerolineae bacterium]|nr:HAMP domain-containing protein [Anaerolineae bacterium]MCO5243131.1 ATP-binding protein [Anaerolineae bacterium]HRX05020.1 ATP-binding protein [Anaerolineae bacterium]
MFRSIRWRIAVPYIVLTLAVLLGLTLLVTNRARAEHLADLKITLLSEARLIGDTATPLLAQSDGQVDELSLDALARGWADLIDGRVTIIAADGVVIGESNRDSDTMENHLNRPEVRDALAGGSGSATRFSATLGQEMMYGAVPIYADNEVVGFARVALPLDQIERSVARLRQPLIVIAIAAAIAVLLVALFIAGRIARPVEQLTVVADRMASGDFSMRGSPTTRDEVGRLTIAFNRMAEELEDKVTRLTRERSRLEAILENLADGIIIADPKGDVRLINPAASELLKTTQATARGSSFANVVRHHQIIDLWQKCRSSGQIQAGAVEIDRQGIFWQVIVTTFQEAYAQGYLVIIQDLSRIRRLETVRRDFVSNISHELRTPLASLRALTETLRDGALDDPPAAERFLDRMETEIDSLTQMVEELLELSRIESGQVALRLKPSDVADIILPPVERLSTQAERYGVLLNVDIAPDLPLVLADTERLRQVVSNLVHNAIKFTPTGGSVTVRAYSGRENQLPRGTRPPGASITGPWPLVIVEVSDTGYGISDRDLPRIFERFYKADRSRGRTGGTGLGLSIARHLVESHKGVIWAESVEGRGSTFRFTVPVA